METTILTSRLKLTLMESAKRGSMELDWLHEMRSDEQCTWWSIYGKSKSIEDTEKYAQLCLPAASNTESGDQNEKPKLYRIAYAVHELLSTDDSTASESQSFRFIGLVTIRSLNGPDELIIPDAYIDASTTNADVLSTEVGYQFLPRAWGNGYATEAVGLVFSAIQRAAPSFWAPCEKVYVRAIVNEENPASQNIMRRLKMNDLGTWEWTGSKVFLAGQWIEKSRICIFGKYLVG